MQNSRNTYIHIQQNIFALQGIILHPATLYLCSLKEFYLFNFKEMIYVLTVKEIHSFKEHISIHKKYNHSRQFYSFAELYSFQGNIFIQGKHLNSRKLYPFREIYSFKEHIFIQGQVLYSFNNVSFADIAEISIQNLSPATL